MTSRIRLKEQNDDSKTWQDDQIETARRIWWWWWRMNHSDPKIFYFATAARLVALVQVSNSGVSIE